MHIDFNRFSIQDVLQRIQDFGVLRIGALIAVLVVYLLLFGIAGKKLKIIMLILAASLAALFAYSKTRAFLLDIPDAVSGLMQSGRSDSGNRTSASSEPASVDGDGWVTVSSLGDSGS